MLSDSDVEAIGQKVNLHGV